MVRLLTEYNAYHIEPVIPAARDITFTGNIKWSGRGAYHEEARDTLIFLIALQIANES